MTNPTEASSIAPLVGIEDAGYPNTQLSEGHVMNAVMEKRPRGSGARWKRRTSNVRDADEAAPFNIPGYVLEQAMYAFGDLPTAQAWLDERHPRLRASPSKVLMREDGHVVVLQLLQAIAEGSEL